MSATMAMRLVNSALFGLVVWITAVSPAGAKYQVLGRAPDTYLDQTQQAEFHRRLMQEYGTYQKHKSAKVRAWFGELSQTNTTEELALLQNVYNLAHRYVVYKEEREDVWYTVGETIPRGYGDCDDYANLYITSAMLLGYDLSRLWLVAGHFYGRYGKIGHAIAVVDGKSGEQWVLDNLYNRVVPEDKHKLFKPVYSINIERQAVFIQINTQFSDVW
jgi:predicted transglutaminase-like cysteine proteinase